MVRKKKQELDIPKCQRTLSQEYNNLRQDREPYLSKALISAQYTIPALITTGDNYGAKEIVTPNQSVGADGVNNLASKVTLTMLPPNQVFFKFTMDDLTIKQLAAETGEDENSFRDKINKGLSQVEKTVLDEMESTSDRVCLGEAQKHLYVAGNVLLVYDPEIGLKYYPLSRYVVKRDYCGNPVMAITEEKIAIGLLPEDIKDNVKLDLLQEKLKTEDKEVKDSDEVTLYTCFKLDDNKWKVYQECRGFILPDSKGQYPKDVCPFIALRYTRVEGESYGRGLIEEYIGDMLCVD